MQGGEGTTPEPVGQTHQRAAHSALALWEAGREPLPRTLLTIGSENWFRR